MRLFKIDEGVPKPRKTKTGKRPSMSFTMLKMEIGDSFLIKDGTYSKTLTAQQAAYCAAKKIGFNVSTRKVDGGVRVWLDGKKKNNGKDMLVQKKTQNDFGSLTKHRDGTLSITASEENWQQLWAVARQGRMFFQAESAHSANCLKFMYLIDGKADILEALGLVRAVEVEQACRDLIKQAYQDKAASAA